MLSDAGTKWMAAGVLGVLVAALIVWIWRVYRSTQYTPSQFPLYMLSLFLTQVLWRVRIEGELDLPSESGAVIVCNHRGPIDPAFIALISPRPVQWMVAKEYFHLPIFRQVLLALECIPTNRGGVDTASTKIAVRNAQRGQVVGLFPEGRINNTDKLMLPGRPGAAMIALKAQVPVIPCYVHGTPYDGTAWGFLFKPARARLRIGRPIDLSSYYGCRTDKRLLEELTLRFMKEIANLAGQPDFQPELAGKRWRHNMDDVSLLDESVDATT